MASVRFKFRSSATFDAIDIGEQSSISIRDLKSKIVVKKHLNLCQDFDLVFSDSISGQEYNDENTRIPSGSTVIIKRIPAKLSPLPRTSDISAECLGVRDAEVVNVIDAPAMDVGVNDFGDFGVDFSPPRPKKISDTGKLLLNKNGKKEYVVPRSSQELVRCQNLEAAQPGQSTRKDSSANEGSTLVMPKPNIEEQTELERTLLAKHLAMESSDMPSELKCSLCRMFFKEAVMIPCCQHSFCGKCIRVALFKNAKCPMCSSIKCKPEDLLPNVSLRQAIERFLESQLLMKDPEDDLHRYAPDGESGIQVKDVSYATSVPQRHMQMKQSGTCDKSNQVMQNKLHGPTHLADKCNLGTLEDFSEFQGENEPQIMAGTNEEDAYAKKGKGSRVITEGGERNITAPSRPNKGPRTCYMCGSPDHLIRDCPSAASSSTDHWNGVPSHPGAVSGYPPPYWPGNPPHSRPFINIYGGPGMMFCNAATAPISPFAFPSCVPSMYGGYPVVSGYMNVGGMTSPVGNIAQHPRHVALPEFQGCAKQQRNYDVDLGRERVSDRDHNFHNANYHHDSTERGPNHSGDSSFRRSKHRCQDNFDVDKYSNCHRQGKTARHVECGDLRKAQLDRSSSEKELLDSRLRPREDKQEKLPRNFRSNDEIGARHGRDSIQRHYESNKENVKRKLREHDGRRPDIHSHSRSRSSLEPSYSSDGARQRREESSHRSRHLNGKEIHHGRGKSKYFDDYGEDCHSHKRERFH